MKIAVTTPTGHVGSRVVRLLIQAGIRPTLLARDPARLDPATREYADVIEADLADAETVVQATQGADALFWVNPRTDDPTADPAAWYAELGANAARAVTENGIGRTLFLSSIGAELRSGAGEIDGLARTEKQLDAASASVLHLRCGYFFTNLLGELDSIREGVQAVHGPEDLTLSQVAAIISHAIGHPVRAETITEEAWRNSLRSAGFGDKQVEGIAGMSAVMREGFAATDKRSIFTTTPTSLAAWAHDHLRAALRSAMR